VKEHARAACIAARVNAKSASPPALSSHQLLEL